MSAIHSLAAYLRDSGGDRQELSTDQQRQAIERWAIQNGYTITIWFTDAARAGSSTIGREQFQALMRHFRSHPSEEGVVMWKMSRFSRDIDDAQFYRADLRRRGYKVISLADNIPDGPEGRFFEAAIDWMNQRFLEDLSEDVTRGLRNLVETYGAVPGTPPRGFKREPIDIGRRRDGSRHTGHRWTPDPEYIPRIQTAFAMRASGRTLPEIHTAVHLYNNLSSYQAFFSNKLYTGVLEYGDLVIPNYCEPIIDQETFAVVQRIIQEVSQGRYDGYKDTPARNPRRAVSSYMLSGLVYCARCGSPLYGKTSPQRNGSNYERYACTGAKNRLACDLVPIPRKVIEATVLRTLREVIYTAPFIAARQEEYQNRLQDARQNYQEERHALGARLGGVRRRISNLTNAIAEEGPTKALTGKLRELEAEEQALLGELEQIKRDEQLIPPSYTPEEIEEMAERLRKNLEEAGDTHTAQIILRGFIHRINADRDGDLVTGQIHFYLPMEANKDPPDDDIINASAPAVRRLPKFLGALNSYKTSQNSTNIEEFLAGLRFEQRGRLEELPFKFC